MKRDLGRLYDDIFDVLVIGGGIYGAAIAREAARSGFKTALIEKGDFGHATSANSLKILHGGLRYLQHLDVVRMRESVSARNQIMRFAPHLSKPLGCLMPLYGYGLKSREIMLIALFVNDCISWDRNNSLQQTKRLPNGSLISTRECVKHIPGIKKKGLRGAGLWYDALALDTERLTLEFLHEAYEYSARLANYVEAKNLVIQNRKVIGVNAEDGLTGSLIPVRSKITINAAGPWAEFLFPSSSNNQNPRQLWAKAINIIVNKEIASKYAFGLEGASIYNDKDATLNKGKRLFFFVPWREGYTMIGTTYRKCNCHPDNIEIKTEDIENIVDEINNAYPRANLSVNDITFVHGGLVPISESSVGDEYNVQLQKNTRIIDHEKVDKISGMLSITGIKYTTSIQTAKKIIEILYKKKYIAKGSWRNGYRWSKCGKKKLFFEIPDESSDRHLAVHLKSLYGDKWELVMKFIVLDEKVDSFVCKKSFLTVGEIKYFIEEEMALTLSDVVFRRSDIGAYECPNNDVLSRIAEIMGDRLKWNDVRRKAEVREVLDRFLPLSKLKN